jgi:adenylate cyclase
MKTAINTPTVSEQIIALADLRGFHRHVCAKLSPEEIFTFLSEYYSVVQRVMDGAEGRIIKFIGDAILLVFRATDPDSAINTLKELKSETDIFLSQAGYDSRLCIKAHVGRVAIGTIGERELERLDICGLAVNQTALLPNDEWILSDDLQRRTDS